MESTALNSRSSCGATTRTLESISVVIPCHNEEQALPLLFSRLTPILEGCGAPFEIILIDDGSTDHTWELLVEAQRSNPSLKIIRLSRNFGHQIALSAGIDQARGTVTILMDADLQDPPELIPQMIAVWREGSDVVYGQRDDRESDSLPKRFFAYWFYRIMNRLSATKVPPDTGDFRLLDRRAINALRSLRENQRFIRGMVSWIGYKQTPIKYRRPPRAAGYSKYPFRRSLLLAIDAITSFSHLPLRMAVVLGLAISAFAFLYIVVVIGLKIAGINFRGYTSIMATMLLLGGVQLIVLGTLGEYIGRIFEQTKSRPLYLIDAVHGEPQLAKDNGQD